MKYALIALAERDITTILNALRLYQAQGTPVYEEIVEGVEGGALDIDETDILCDRINSPDPVDIMLELSGGYVNLAIVDDMFDNLSISVLDGDTDSMDSNDLSIVSLDNVGTESRFVYDVPVETRPDVVGRFRAELANEAIVNEAAEPEDLELRKDQEFESEQEERFVKDLFSSVTPPLALQDAG